MYVVIRSEFLKLHGGVIQEGFNFEFPGTANYDYLGMHIVGLNGQLPNADIPMTMTSISESVGARTTLHGEWEFPMTRKSWAEYERNLRNVAVYMKNQALGFPSSHHAFFSK